MLKFIYIKFQQKSSHSKFNKANIVSNKVRIIMENKSQDLELLLAKYQLNTEFGGLDKQMGMKSLQQALDEIIQIGSNMFSQNNHNKLNKYLNQGLIQKRLNQNLLKNNKNHWKKQNNNQCYSERYSQCQNPSIFNMKEDDWISEDNYFDNYHKEDNSKFQNTKKSNHQRTKIIKQQNKTNKISDQLLKPVRNFKKKVLQEVQEKKKKQQEELISIQIKNKSHISLSEFYEQNKKHLPVYKKAEIIQTKKRRLIQKRKVDLNIKTMEKVTFKPIITNQAKQISKTFQQRLQQNKQNKATKQHKLIIEELKNSPFRPKINKSSSSNINAQSRVKSIWTNQKSLLQKSQRGPQFSNWSFLKTDKDRSKLKSKANEQRMVNQFAIAQKDIPLFQQFAIE